MVSAFSQWWVSVIYIASMVVLALHLFHGAWSMFQSLGINNPRFNAARKIAVAFAVIVCGINITFPDRGLGRRGRKVRDGHMTDITLDAKVPRGRSRTGGPTTSSR